MLRGCESESAAELESQFILRLPQVRVLTINLQYEIHPSLRALSK